uniref:Guanine nucleotide-binding protein subunit gamma n=2 Tax=Felis catus TaxID=9685 RepID=A0ABI8A6L2_FELCA
FPSRAPGRASTCQNGSRGPALEVASGPLGACAPSAYLHVVVHAVIGDTQQGAVVAPQGLPARGDLKFPQLLQLGHGPPACGWLPWEPAGFAPHPVLDWSLSLPHPPPPHRFWFPLRERPKPACKGQAGSFRDKRKCPRGGRMAQELSEKDLLKMNVEQLKKEVKNARVPISKTGKEIKDFVEAEAGNDPLLKGVPEDKNPFKEKGSCVIS